jgi:hypothetical protein
VANALNLFRQVAVGFIDWLDGRHGNRKSIRVQSLLEFFNVTSPKYNEPRNVSTGMLNLKPVT